MVVIEKACRSQEEIEQLYPALSDFSHDGSRNNYADWLNSQGETSKAESVLATIEAYQSLDLTALKNLSGNEVWLDMIGANLLQIFLESSSEEKTERRIFIRDTTFAMARPALELDYRRSSEVPDIGESYLWGQADLPVDQDWPVFSECSDWFSCRDDLPPDYPCAFLGQFFYKDFKGCLLSEELPKTGGFSVFTITEPIKLGIVETVLRPLEPGSALSRRVTPEALVSDPLGDGYNSPHDYHTIILKEFLSLPNFGNGAFNDFSFDEHHAAEWDRNVTGLGGYLRGTSGQDPSPGRDHVRLAVLRTNPDVGIVHFAIPSEDLKKGELKNAEYVWNDWDS